MLGKLIGIAFVVSVVADKRKVVISRCLFHIMIVADVGSRMRLYFILKCFSMNVPHKEIQHVVVCCISLSDFMVLV